MDLAWLTRIGRAYAEGLRLAANVENEAYRARFTGPVRASGADQRTVMELASQLATAFLPLVDRALMGIYRRQQEVVWTEDLVEDIETELEAAGVLTRPQRVPAMSFLDLVGYTRLTEERSDQAAAELAGSLAVLVDRSSREHGGVPVKWLGDGVMVHFRDPPGGGAGGAGDGGAAAPGGPAARARRGRGRASGGPGRRLLRPHRQPALRHQAWGAPSQSRGSVSLPRGSEPVAGLERV